MIIQYDPDAPVLGVVFMGKREKLDKLSTPVAFSDKPEDMAVMKINAGKKRKGTVSSVLMVFVPRGMETGYRWQIRGHGRNCLNARLFIVGDGGFFPSLFAVKDLLDLLVDDKHLRHFFFKLFIPSFEVEALEVGWI